MKRIATLALIALGIALGSATTSYGQTYNREGKTFVQEKGVRASISASKDIETDYVWKDGKGIEYPIWLHQYTKGDNQGKWTAYVIRTSAKSGKEYKSYLKEGQSIAEEIRKEMGI